MEKFISFFEDSRSFYLIKTNMLGRYTYVNQFFKDKFGHISSNFIGTDISNTVYEEDLHKCNETVIKCVQNPGRVFSTLIRKPALDQTFYWTYWEFQCITNDLDEAQEIICFGTDFTELIKHSDIIRQYAFQTAHHIRKPITEISRLLNDIKEKNQGQEDESVYKMEKALNELNGGLHHLLNAVVNNGDFRFLINKPKEINKITIVDDDKIYLFMINKMIQNIDSKITCFSFQTGQEAIINIDKDQPDIILLDIHMPDYDGWDFLNDMMIKGYRNPVIIVSSSIDPNDILKAKNFPNVINYITKPVENAVLFELLKGK